MTDTCDACGDKGYVVQEYTGRHIACGRCLCDDTWSLRRRVATLERRLARVLRVAHLQRNSLAHGLTFSASWQERTWRKVGRVWSGRRRP